ncbi:hypothetical protein ABT009_25270 [Streptomyces sp. NPDC002896]|uniref:hypothetical protein n=1 Tax=Streptomyces sp. NPDC002896 TaxID=3154438 RepID=UPI00332B2493
MPAQEYPQEPAGTHVLADELPHQSYDLSYDLARLVLVHRSAPPLRRVPLGKPAGVGT